MNGRTARLINKLASDRYQRAKKAKKRVDPGLARRLKRQWKRLPDKFKARVRAAMIRELKTGEMVTPTS